MPRKHHDLKIETEYYQAVERGDKTFEVRKNDCDFQRYDMIVLSEVVNGIPTGRKLEPMEVVYILRGGVFGIAPDYCVMQVKRYYEKSNYIEIYSKIPIPCNDRKRQIRMGKRKKRFRHFPSQRGA